MQLGLDQMHLPQIRPGRVEPHRMQVLNRRPHMRVALDPEPLDQPPAVTRLSPSPTIATRRTGPLGACVGGAWDGGAWDGGA